jgi:anti-sigma factor RsiW
MHDLDRVVGGLRCRDVLVLLAEFVDHELDADSLDRVRLHLAGCDTCEKFGGEYADLVARLRAATTPSVESGVRRRLNGRLEALWGEEAGE